MRRCLNLIYGLAFIAVAGFGCMRVAQPPEDLSYEEIPSYAWESLKLERSFNYQYSIFTEALQFSVDGSGKVVMPDALSFKGTWQLGEDVRRLDLAAAGDYQLSKENGVWNLSQRSDEAKILEQTDRVLRKSLEKKKGKGFTLVVDEGKTLTYSFKPNVAYLDPGFKKKFDAQFIVDGRTLLAKEIKVISTDSAVGYELKIFRINQARNIKLPFSSNFQIIYSPEDGSVGNARKVIKKRLSDLGRKSRISNVNGDVRVMLAFPVDETIARDISEQGTLLILGLDLDGAGPNISKRGDVSDIFHISDTVAWPKVRTAQVAFDSLSRPLVNLELTRAEPVSRSYDYLGIVVDGVLYEVLAVDNPTDFIRIANVPTYQDAVGLAVKLERPMRAQVGYVEQERIR